MGDSKTSMRIIPPDSDTRGDRSRGLRCSSGEAVTPMHRSALLAGAPLLLALGAGCSTSHYGATGPSTTLVGSGRFVSESRPLQAVSRIVTTGGLRITVTHTSIETLDITAEDNILPLIEVVKRNGTLVLGWKPDTGSVSAHGIDIRIDVRELHAVDASGGSQMDVRGIGARDFSVTLSGAAL